MVTTQPTLSGRTPDGKAVKIRENAWGNWYGYISGKVAEHFFNGDKTQEENAKDWLERQICPEHFQDNQGLCHRCGNLMDEGLYNHYLGIDQ